MLLLWQSLCMNDIKAMTVYAIMCIYADGDFQDQFTIYLHIVPITYVLQATKCVGILGSLNVHLQEYGTVAIGQIRHLSPPVSISATSLMYFEDAVTEFQAVVGLQGELIHTGNYVQLDTQDSHVSS